MSETPKKFKKHIKSQLNTLVSQLAAIDGLIDVIVVSDVQSNMVDVLEIVDCQKMNHAAAETLFEMYAGQLSSDGGSGGGTKSSRKRNAKQDDASSKMAPRKKKKKTQKIIQVLDDSNDEDGEKP